MKSPKALLFDLDGTILDSKKNIIDAVYMTANHYVPGKFCYSDIEARFGESWDSFLPLLECPDRDAVMNTYLEHVRKTHDETVIPFPGMTEALYLLRSAGFKLAVVTNKQWSLTVRGLRLWEIDAFFDVIVTADDVRNGKPHPEPIKKACRELKVTRDEALMIGDSNYDIFAANMAGVRCAIIDWYKAYRVSHWMPDYYCYNIEEMLELLLNWLVKEAV